MRGFDTLLIANRGEIALRIMRSARRLGLRCIAVHSDADTGAPHVAAADAAVRIGPAEPRASYLDTAAILDAARRTGAEAVHPGYGFLSENADFARAATEAGLIFVSPPANVIAAMGDKAAAKAIARQAGVPCLDGYEGEDQSDAAFAAEAARIGFPVMVKAAAGGGGRGMRLVETAADLLPALAIARTEAQQAFGNGCLLLEPALVRARHVEIQILADAHGNTLHLGERDCSVQRRHQKLIEESPAITADLRDAMGRAAVNLARTVGYVGAGTVEFLLAADGRFVFMEMNTRLQVEHAVTEALTGLDLVEWQLRIAMGEALPFAQDDIRLDGHAIEARLCAEDPARDFAPRHGPVLRWRPPQDHGVRVDHALADAGSVSRHYDTMVAKLIAHGRTRDEARRRLAAALDATVLLGPPTNRAFLAACLRHPEFAAAPPDTGFLGRTGALIHPDAMPPPEAVAVAALLAAGIGPQTRPDIGGGPGRTLHLAAAERSWGLHLASAESGWQVAWQDGETRHCLNVRLLSAPADGALLAEVDGMTLPAVQAEDAAALHLHIGGRDWHFRRPDQEGAEEQDAGSGVVRAPFTGMIASLAVAPGTHVTRGAALLVLEAMKVQTKIVAPCDGVVTELPAAGRREVSAGTTLVVIQPEEAEGG